MARPGGPLALGTGDSAIEAYLPWCDQQIECASAEQLLAAIARLPW